MDIDSIGIDDDAEVDVVVDADADVDAVADDDADAGTNSGSICIIAASRIRLASAT